KLDTLSGFSNQSLLALEPCFDQLIMLNVGKCESSIVQKILESCPRLEDFKANVIKGLDIISGKPWVCHQTLRDLTIKFDMTIPEFSIITFSELNKRVFDQLSKVVNLESLNAKYPRQSRLISLSFRLQDGLEQLA